MEKKDFNFVTPVQININSSELPKIIRKKDKEQLNAFLLQQKRKEEDLYLSQLLKNNTSSSIQ
jgi:hypothetical protein